MVLTTLLAASLLDDFHGSASISSSFNSVVPGQQFQVVIRISLDPGWHTYWKNPGDAGIAPKLSWVLPKGWSAGECRWPTPKRIESPEVVSYGYERQVLLFVPITAPRNAKLGSVARLKAKVDWLVCKDGCIPASNSIEESVRVGLHPLSSHKWTREIVQAERELPRAYPAQGEIAVRDDHTIWLSLKHAKNTSSESVTFYSEDAVVEPSAPQKLSFDGSGSTLSLRVSQFAPATVPRLRGLLVVRRGATVVSRILDIPLKRKIR